MARRRTKGRGNGDGTLFQRGGKGPFIMEWYEGNRRKSKSTRQTVRTLAEQVFTAHMDRVRRIATGMIQPRDLRIADASRLQIVTHIEDFTASMEAEKRDPRHVKGTGGYLRDAVGGLEWASVADIEAAPLAAYVARKQKEGKRSARWFNAYMSAWGAFSKWLVANGRVSTNPLPKLPHQNIDADRRRERRALSADEVAWLVKIADQTPRVSIARRYRKVKGGPVTEGRVLVDLPDRGRAYEIAAGTGFRAGEVDSLRPCDFDLTADQPVIRCRAAYTKNGSLAEQPIRRDLAARLRGWLKGKDPSKALNPIGGKAGAVMAEDLRLAREAWLAEAGTPSERARREGTDFLRCANQRGQVADFHALRVSYVTDILDAGASAAEAMTLARHSDPKLTLKVYNRMRLTSIQRVLDKLATPSNDTQQQHPPRMATGA